MFEKIFYGDQILAPKEPTRVEHFMESHSMRCLTALYTKLKEHAIDQRPSLFCLVDIVERKRFIALTFNLNVSKVFL